MANNNKNEEKRAEDTWGPWEDRAGVWTRLLYKQEIFPPTKNPWGRIRQKNWRGKYEGRGSRDAGPDYKYCLWWQNKQCPIIVGFWLRQWWWWLRLERYFKKLQKYGLLPTNLVQTGNLDFCSQNIYFREALKTSPCYVAIIVLHARDQPFSVGGLGALEPSKKRHGTHWSRALKQSKGGEHSFGQRWVEIPIWAAWPLGKCSTTPSPPPPPPPTSSSSSLSPSRWWHHHHICTSSGLDR